MLDFGFFACSLLALFVVWLLKPAVLTFTLPLRHVPGPFLARFTRLWELRQILQHDFATFNIALHRKYEPVVRLAPNRYSIADAEAARIILGHGSVLDKSGYYMAFGLPAISNLFTEPNKSVHAKMRRPVAQLYSNTNLMSYEPFVETCNQILAHRLREHARHGDRFDMRELMQYYAFDVIGEITVGSRFGLMEEAGDKSGIIDAIDRGIYTGATFGIVPEAFLALFHVTCFLKLTPNFQRVLDFINTNIHNRVSGKTKSREDRQDFLDKLLPLEQEGKATRRDTLNACGSNIGAGSDTTAISLVAVFAYLAMHPTVLARLRQELDDAMNNGTISDPITFREAQGLPYLRAVINESLRVHPAVGAPLTRIVGKDGANLAGHYFPPGSEVGVNPWVMHYNEEIFGSDAAQFKPERWLTDDAEKRSFMERNSFAFGAGPRVCIGKNISLLEMNKVIPQIVRKFDFELVSDSETGKGYSWKTFWFTKQNFKCVVRERTHKETLV
ncbi:pisatin demethylase [Stemphylium lycopersici]|nr:pisatin demethylase [Stemphylium lycopersici]